MRLIRAWTRQVSVSANCNNNRHSFVHNCNIIERICVLIFLVDIRAYEIHACMRWCCWTKRKRANNNWKWPNVFLSIVVVLSNWIFRFFIWDLSSRNDEINMVGDIILFVFMFLISKLHYNVVFDVWCCYARQSNNLNGGNSNIFFSNDTGEVEKKKPELVERKSVWRNYDLAGNHFKLHFIKRHTHTHTHSN